MTVSAEFLEQLQEALQDPNIVNLLHQYSDYDLSPDGLHHPLGTRHDNAAYGDHQHNGTDSTGALALSGNLTVKGNVEVAGAVASPIGVAHLEVKNNPSDLGSVGIAVEAIAGQTAPLIETLDSSGNPSFQVMPDGGLKAGVGAKTFLPYGGGASSGPNLSIAGNQLVALSVGNANSGILQAATAFGTVYRNNYGIGTFNVGLPTLIAVTCRPVDGSGLFGAVYFVFTMRESGGAVPAVTMSNNWNGGSNIMGNTASPPAGTVGFFINSMATDATSFQFGLNNNCGRQIGATVVALPLGV